MTIYFTIAVIYFLVFKLHVWRKGILFRKSIIPKDKLDWAENFGLVLGSVCWPTMMCYHIVFLIIDVIERAKYKGPVLDVSQLDSRMHLIPKKKLAPGTCKRCEGDGLEMRFDLDRKNWPNCYDCKGTGVTDDKKKKT